MAFTKTWDETKPDGSEPAHTLDTIIQDLKVAIRERLDVEHEFKTDGTGSMNHRQITIGTTPNSDDMYAFKSFAVAYDIYFRIISECTINGVTGSALTFNAKWNGSSWAKDYTSWAASAILLSTGAVHAFAMSNSSTNWYNSWLLNDPSAIMRGVTEVLDTYFPTTNKQTICYFPVYIENVSEQRIKAKLLKKTTTGVTFRLENADTNALLASMFSPGGGSWAAVNLDGIPDVTGTILVRVTAQPDAAPVYLYTLLEGWFVGVS